MGDTLAKEYLFCKDFIHMQRIRIACYSYKMGQIIFGYYFF